MARQPLATAPLARLATRQHGVVSRHQLSELGVSHQAVQTLVGRGFLIRVHRGVYAVGHARLGARGRWMAAVLACGDGAALSHRDAAALHDLRTAGSGPVHVTARSRHRVPGVRCHVTRIEHPQIMIVDAIPVTSLERAVLDEAPTVSPQRLRALLEAAQRRNRFDQARFDLVLAAGNGHHGIGALRAALAELADEAPDLRSSLEARFLAIVRAAGLPEPSANVIVAGELVDFHWPRQRVIAEIDSWAFHRSRRSFEQDRRRGNAFVLAGQLLLRITDRRIEFEPDAVARDVATALRGRPA